MDILKSIIALCQQYQSIFIYVSKEDEFPTRDIISNLLKAKKNIIVPKCISNEQLACYKINNFNDLTFGMFDILEPKTDCSQIDKDDIELFIVPGRYFDFEGNRQGRGKGYFDRFLMDIKGKKPIVALAYEYQLRNKLVQDDHDVQVDLIITEKRRIICNDKFNFKTN
jgi:5-formyltetrahydrofolate cyclo-ligase